MRARGFRLEPGKVDARDVVLFALAVLVPFGFVVWLGLRAAENEEAALERARSLRADAAAERAAGAVTREIARATADLGAFAVPEDDEEPPSPESLYASAQMIAPRFARAWVVDSTKRIALPRQVGARESAVAPLSTELRTTCAAKLDGARAGDEAARTDFLAKCEDHRSDAGRWPWSSMALRRLAVDPSPEAVARVAAWLGRHAGDMRAVEREANRREIVALASLSEAQRAELARSIEGDGGDVSDVSRWIRTEDAQSAFARAEREGTATLRSREGVGAVRFTGGYFVGFFAGRADLARFVATPSEEGLTLSLASDDTRVHEGEAVAFVTESLGVHAVPRGDDDLSAATSRSRTRIGITLAVALVAIGGLVGLLYARMLRARRVAELRTSFVAAVSHELRTPIASLRLLSDLLEDDDMPSEERREIVAAARKETGRLAATVERFLDFSKLAADRASLARTPADLGDVVRRSVETFRARHPDREVALEATDPAVTDLDAAAVEVVVDNLLENARRYAPDAGPIAVSVRAGAGRAEVRVADRGPGVPAALRKKIFEPFERGDDRLSRATEGTGIGLALVRAIARGHGGDATVVAGEPSGATFVVWFPMERS